MLIIALTAAGGAGAILFLTSYFIHRAAARRAAARSAVEADVATKLRKAQQIDETLAKSVMAGQPVDQAITEYQRSRAALVTAVRGEQPWAWDADDLHSWADDQLRHRGDEVNRSTLVTALGTCLVVLAVTAIILGMTYQALNSRSASERPVSVDGPTLPPPAPADASAPATTPDPAASQP